MGFQEVYKKINLGGYYVYFYFLFFFQHLSSPYIIQYQYQINFVVKMEELITYCKLSIIKRKILPNCLKGKY